MCWNPQPSPWALGRPLKGSPTLGPDESFLSSVGSQRGSPPAAWGRAWPGRATQLGVSLLPAPRACSHQVLGTTAAQGAALESGSFLPFSSRDVGQSVVPGRAGHRSGSPRWGRSGRTWGGGRGPSAAPGPFVASLRFAFGELAPQLLSLSSILCLLSRGSLLQAWEGSGDASFCNTRTIWP